MRHRPNFSVLLVSDTASHGIVHYLPGERGNVQFPSVLLWCIYLYSLQHPQLVVADSRVSNNKTGSMDNSMRSG
jgi:hypothetical protein